MYWSVNNGSEAILSHVYVDPVFKQREWTVGLWKKKITNLQAGVTRFGFKLLDEHWGSSVGGIL